MKLILADDHLLVVEALEAYLAKLRPDIEILRALNFDQVLKHLAESRGIDLVMLDLYMPGTDGLRGLRLIRDKWPDLPVVIISGQADGRQIREALESEAAGFIPKDLSGKAMLSAMELVLSGATYVPEAALFGISQDDTHSTSGASLLDNPLESLTSRENEVLRLLVKGHANRDIACDLGFSDGTVAFHLKNVYRKLNVSSRTQAVRRAIMLGMQISHSVE